MVSSHPSNSATARQKKSDGAELRGAVLVTGAAGFVGFHVCQRLVGNGYKVIALDSIEDGLYGQDEKLSRMAKLSKIDHVVTVRLDLNRWSSKLEMLELPPIVGTIHLAAMPGLRLSWKALPLYTSSNIDACASALEMTRFLGGSRFVHISTSSVYGRNVDGKLHQVASPVSPYGITKLAGEKLVEVLARDYGVSYSILRLFSVYGPEQRPDMAYRRFIDAALSGTSATLYGDGSQSRTNTYVEDAASGIINAFELGKDGEIYNIGGSELIQLSSAIATIERLTERRIRLLSKPAARGDQMQTVANIESATADFGFQNGTSFENGIRKQIAWSRSRLFPSANIN